MPKIDVLDAQGKATTTADLDDAVFGVTPNGAVLHQVVTAQLAARRAGTQSTKTRAEVAGGGAKPWKQKGTGRARQGSIRSPQWSGGGVALGPKPRSYAQRTPKKMVRLALRSALSDRAADGKVKVVDFGWTSPKTASAVAALADLGIEGKVLLVLQPDDTATWKSFRNLGHVHILTSTELNAYDVLVSDWVVFTPASIPGDTPLSRGGHGDRPGPEPHSAAEADTGAGAGSVSGASSASETSSAPEARPAPELQPAPEGHRGGAPGERDEVPIVTEDAVEDPVAGDDHVEAPVVDATDDAATDDAATDDVEEDT